MKKRIHFTTLIVKSKYVMTEYTDVACNEDTTDEQLNQVPRQIIDSWNATLRQGESPRELVSVDNIEWLNKPKTKKDLFLDELQHVINEVLEGELLYSIVGQVLDYNERDDLSLDIIKEITKIEPFHDFIKNLDSKE